MRRKLLILCVGLLLLVGLAVPLAAQAGGIFHGSGDSAYASFFATEGNIQTDLWVEAMKGKEQSPPGKGTTFSQAYVYIYSWDTDSGDVLASGWGYKNLGVKEFSVGGGLKTAALKTTIPMNDWVTGDPFDLDVVVDWTGDGRAIRERSIYHYLYPGIHYSSSYSYAAKAAVAQGTFAVDGSPVFSGMTDQAMIGKNTQRQTIVE